MSTQTAAGRDRGSGAAKPSPALKRAADWARRAPLLPALIFVIIMTQIPFAATLVISFMNWNAYYPEERGFAGVDNFVRVFTDTNSPLSGGRDGGADRVGRAGQPAPRPGDRAAAGPQVPRPLGSCGR